MIARLLIIKDKLKEIYAKAGIYIKHVLCFILAFASTMILSRGIGYNGMFSSPFICLAISIICAFLPIGVIVVVLTTYIVVQLFGLSLELALISLGVILVVYLLYFRFAPKTGFLLILTPILFYLHIPYVIPVIAALTVGATGIIPVTCGIFIFYLVDFASSYATAISTLNEDNALQNINFIFNNILTNKEMVVVAIAFSVTIMIIYIIKKLSVNYSWIIAVVSGCIVDMIIQIVAFAVTGVHYNALWIIVGHLAAVLIGLILNLFIFSVDYSSTEYVQFEDDDYFYYVKAVPKISVTGKDVKFKKINTIKDNRNFVHTEGFEAEEEDKEQ